MSVKGSVFTAVAGSPCSALPRCGCADWRTPGSDSAEPDKKRMDNHYNNYEKSVGRPGGETGKPAGNMIPGADRQSPQSVQVGPGDRFVMVFAESAP
jgi:hypothetical protein